MKEATSELLNQKRIKEILKSEGAKTVSAEAVEWIGAVAREAAKNLAQSGRRTPGGRLMAPKMDAGLMARHLADPHNQAIAAGVELAQDPGAPAWGPREDWQAAVRRGETKLPFEEWKKGKGK